MKCPSCDLTNPPGTLVCDCGYAFPTQASGRAEGDGTTPPYKLFDHRAVGLAAFLGQPLGASIVMAVNSLRLGEGAPAAAATIAIGLLVTALVVGLDLALASKSLSMLLNLAVLFLTVKCARAVQGLRIKEHTSRGGQLASRWAAARIGGAVLLFTGLSAYAIMQAREAKVSRMSAQALSVADQKEKATEEWAGAAANLIVDNWDKHPQDKAGETGKAAADLNTLRARAEQGEIHAQVQLANMYHRGSGVARDDSEAIRWYRNAAGKGDAEGQFNVGMAYRGWLGGWIGSAEDDRQSATWLRKAAEQRHAGAQYELGQLYRNGNGVLQNHSEAARWFRKAGDQEYMRAYYILGLIYQGGQGVKRDYAEALRWYRKLAEEGSPSERFLAASGRLELARMYETGEAVARDYVQAFMWLKLADTGDISKEVITEVRQDLTPKMTAEEIARAERLAREWKPKAKGEK